MPEPQVDKKAVAIIAMRPHETGDDPEAWMLKARFEWHQPEPRYELRMELANAGCPPEEINEVCSPDEQMLVKFTIDDQEFLIKKGSLDHVMRWLDAKAEHEGMVIG